MVSYLNRPVYRVNSYPYPGYQATDEVVLYQIEYYFSNQNLVKDMYLRRHMDNQGWVSIEVIYNFPRIKNLSTSKEHILEILKLSSNIEVNDGKLRNKHNWKHWVNPNNSEFDPQAMYRSTPQQEQNNLQEQQTQPQPYQNVFNQPQPQPQQQQLEYQTGVCWSNTFIVRKQYLCRSSGDQTRNNYCVRVVDKTHS